MKVAIKTAREIDVKYLKVDADGNIVDWKCDEEIIQELIKGDFNYEE